MGTVHPISSTTGGKRAVNWEAKNEVQRAARQYHVEMVAEGRWVPTVARNRNYQLRKFTDHCGNRPMRVLGPDLVRSYRASLAHLSLGTQRNHWVALKGFTGWAVDRNLIRRDPCHGIPAPKVPRSVHRNLSADAAARLIAACPDSRARCVVILGLQLGLRRAEIAGIQLGDIDFDLGVVTIHGKGGHVRLVPLTDEAATAIAAYLHDEPARRGPLIRSRREPAKALTPDGLGVLVSHWAKAAGVKVAAFDGVGTHSLRHTAATDVYRQGGDVMVIRDMLGHASLSTTQIYVRGMDLEPLRAAIEGRNYAA